MATASPDPSSAHPVRIIRPKRRHAPVHSDRWLVSYADFMTLLFAFFTTMYATSNVDVVKLNRVVQSMQQAFKPNAQGGAPSGGGASIPAVASPAVSASDQHDLDLQKELRDRLSEELKNGSVTLNIDSRGVVISLRESGSFPVGNADLTPDAREMLSHLASTIADLNSTIRVEGHTDDVPIRTSRFASNWDLSTARAVSVLQYMVTTGGIPASRLSASGYGEFHPVVPNDSAENRAKNRRVDLVLLNSGTRAAQEPNAPVPLPEASREPKR